ncbi:MAG TPA: DUF2997 domain-containing protein [Candidatus Brocadiia bacterium]|nr:DUF2997 domain-containing protein [Candidatus Brocadiia bacterium]
MARAQRIEFIIKPDGSVEESVSGIQGPDCEKVTKPFDEALGDIAKREKKAEFHQRQTGRGFAQNTSKG